MTLKLFTALLLLYPQYVPSGQHAPHSGGSCSLSGMAATYDFSACTPGMITTQSDSTGSNTATSAGTITCLAGQQNGLNAVSVAGASFMTLASSVACTTTCTIYAIIKPAATDIGLFGSTTGSSNAQLDLRAPSATSHVELDQASTAAIGISTGTLASATWVRIAVGYSGGTASFFIAGTASGTGSGAVTITNGPNIILSSVSGGSVVHQFNGEVGFIGFATAAYNSANDACLGTKWAL